MTLPTGNFARARAAALLVLSVALAASAYVHAAQGVTGYVSAISLSDQNGVVRAKAYVTGDKLSFTDGAGRPLRITAESLKPPLAPLSELEVAGEKADGFDQKAIEVLQSQVDTMSAKINELTARVNELSTR